MFESITIITLSLIAFCVYQNLDLGLTAKVPKDPRNRVQTFAAQCLGTVKERLAGATCVQLEGNKVAFRRAGTDSGVESLWSDQGCLWGQADGQKPVKLNELGQDGKVTFEKLSDDGLYVKIHAQLDANIEKDVGVRLTASFA